MSKQMMSRFRSKCRECDATIQAGDPITWHGKGAGVSCSACEPVDLRAFYTPGGVTQPDDSAQPNGPQPVNSGPLNIGGDAGAFDPALSWDDTPPAPGKSIGESGIKTADALAALDRIADAAPKTKAPNGATMQPVQSDERDATRAVVELAAQRVKRDAERDSAPELDALAATVCDLLVVLVNCIDRLDADQCDALRSHANRNSAESASGSRRRLWQSLGRAIG